MIKQLWVAQCDICGACQSAKECMGRYNEAEHALPEGWTRSQINNDVCICPECAKKFNRPQINVRNIDQGIWTEGAKSDVDCRTESGIDAEA